MNSISKTYIILLTTLLLSACVSTKQYSVVLNQQNQLQHSLDSITKTYIYEVTTYRDSLIATNLRADTLSFKNQILETRIDSIENVLKNLNDSIINLQKTALSNKEQIDKLEKEIKRINQKIIELNKKSNSPSSSESKSKADKISHNEHSFDIYKVDFPNETVQFYWKDNVGGKLMSITSLKKYVETKGQELVFATNAGMYMPDNSPQGLYVENKKELIPIDLDIKEYGNFYMQPNGIFLITKTEVKVVPSSDYHKYKNNVLYATQSGPMLVINGEINSKFTKGSSNTYIRSGVGITKEGIPVFAISNEPVNFYDFATLFKEKLKCDNALYLDGAISKMYIPKLNRLELGGNFGAMIGITK